MYSYSCWSLSLPCSPPILLSSLPPALSMQAKNDDAAGNAAAAKIKGNIALTLNIMAVLFHFVAIIAIVTPIAVTISSNFNNYYYYYYDNYYYIYCYYTYHYYCQYCSYLSYSYCSYSYSYSSSYSSYTYSYYSCS